MKITATFDPQALLEEIQSQTGSNDPGLQSIIAQQLGYDSWTHLISECSNRQRNFKDAALEQLYLSPAERKTALSTQRVPGSHFIPQVAAPYRERISALLDTIAEDVCAHLGELMPWGLFDPQLVQVTHRKWLSSRLFTYKATLSYKTEMVEGEAPIEVRTELFARVIYDPDTFRGSMRIDVGAAADSLNLEFKLTSQTIKFLAEKSKFNRISENLELIRGKVLALKTQCERGTAAAAAGGPDANIQFKIAMALGSIGTARGLLESKEGLPRYLALYTVPELPAFVSAEMADHSCQTASLLEFAKWASVQGDCIKIRTTNKSTGATDLLELGPLLKPQSQPLIKANNS